MFTEGELKGMYRHGDEGERLTAISPNHLDVRDTVSTDWLHYQRNTHAYSMLGPCSEWSALAFCALAGEDVGGVGGGWGGEGRLPW